MITGDYSTHADTTFTVTDYDSGLTLLTVTVDGKMYPIEITHHDALKLASALAKGRE